MMSEDKLVVASQRWIMSKQITSPLLTCDPTYIFIVCSLAQQMHIFLSVRVASENN